MSTTGEEEIQYGNLRRPSLPGLFRMGPIESGILILGTLVMMLLIFLANLWVAVGFMGVVLAAVLPQGIKTKDGEGHYTKWLGQLRWRRVAKQRKNVLAQGLTGLVPDGGCRLPGVAAQVQVTTEHDVHGREFGMIAWSETNLYSVVIKVFPPGRSGLDKDVFDRQVAQWAAWLGQLNHVGEVVGASVVTESAPDSGERLRRAIDRGRDSAAPAFSRAIAEEIKASSRSGSPVVTTRITITFDAKIESALRKGAHVRSREEMAAAIGDVLPNLTSTLAGTGAGQGVPAKAQDITDIVRVAYDPAVAGFVEEAQHSGGTGLTWDQAGPTTAVNHFDFYQHETAVSRTWQMREGPKGLFFSNVLDQLLAPHRDVARKRVVLLYRPEDAARSQAIAENDVTAAQLVESQNPRRRQADRIAVEAATKTAQQEAMGSPLIRVGLLVTVTVFDERQLDRASSVLLRTLSPQARLQMRLPRGTQDAAFAAALPLGMVPYFHSGLSSFADGM
jgi:hypothetical protein